MVNNISYSPIVVLTYDGTISVYNQWEEIISELFNVCSFMNCPIANIVKMFLECDDRTYMIANGMEINVSFNSRFFAMMFYIRERIGDSLLNFPDLEGQMIMNDNSFPAVVLLTDDDIESALKIIQYHDY